MKPIAANVIILLGVFALRAWAADATERQLERRFNETIQPFVTTYCTACHGKEKQKGQVNLSTYTTMDSVARDYRLWETVLEKIKSEEMPPEEAKQHPAKKLRAEVVNWIHALRAHEAKQNAGDPGPVLARRLSNSEYDYTIRDLTGADIRPTKEFPIDPANEAGFDNSGESLAMSPALLKKYLEASRKVSEHLVLKPEGFAFAPHPVVTDTDRDKYVVRRIIDFYQRQPTNHVDYFMAAWRFQHRAALGQRRATLADFATESKISPKYLATIWSALTAKPEELGPIAVLQTMWRTLPAPSKLQPDIARAGCEQMRDFAVTLRLQLVPEVKNLTGGGVHEGSQTMVLWKDRQFAANRRRYADNAAQIKLDKLSLAPELAKVLIAPEDAIAKKQFDAGFKRFCDVFPDVFLVSERARVYLNPEQEKKLAGRLLSAGFHSQMGYFRDDGPLYDMLLNEREQRELDALWQELDFISAAPMRQHTGFIWFERTDSRFMISAEFDFARAEDKAATSEPKIKQLAEVYLAKAKSGGASSVALEAIDTHFKTINANIRWVEQARVAAEPSHLKSLQAFAERAYRRPLAQHEHDDLINFYHSVRNDGVEHEEAMRESIVSVLMSPYFLYRVDLAPLASGRSQRKETQPSGIHSLLTPSAAVRQNGAVPLSDYELASRLSYFLWSSLPDEELLAHAAAGDLRQSKVLLAQTRRMLKDERVRGLATEFAGNWLDIRQFENHNAVDRERFPVFNDHLRQSMFEEPIRFFVDVARENRSVLDFLYGNYTFVNPALAKHYGMPELNVATNHWVRIDNAHRFERGGLLPMSVFLTANAPGLRTSPVKRGYWVVRRVLGEQIPPPPPTVPVLPNDEAKLGELTLREVLAKHREDKSCSGCHARFDSFGLVFEGFGPVGELRTKDLGGRPVDTHATFPGGSEGTGLDGLRTYLRTHRQEDFLDNLCRKLLTYALGRSLLLSDESTLKEMRTKLAASSSRFGSLVETIVTSPQFLNKRGSSELAKK